jgi:hypothetical protein
VKDVKLELSDKRVEIELVWTAGAKGTCPVCGRVCALYDYAPERTWRHLDTMQFQTVIRARVPRIECASDGVKTVGSISVHLRLVYASGAGSDAYW